MNGMKALKGGAQLPLAFLRLPLRRKRHRNHLRQFRTDPDSGIMRHKSEWAAPRVRVAHP